MDASNHVAKLYEYAQKTNSTLTFEDVPTTAPDQSRPFTISVSINKKVYPKGVGRTKKEAKQAAAKNAWEWITDVSQSDFSVNSMAQCSSPLPSQRSITQANYICWLNEHSYKLYKVAATPVESTRVGPANTLLFVCKFVVGGKEFPEACGKIKKEAKEEAARAVYQELYGENATKTGDETHSETAAEPKEKQSTSGFGDETNYVGLLNNYCQTKKMVHDFILVDRSGPAHIPQFIYKFVADGKEYPKGKGSSAKEAKQQAARLAWNALQGSPDGISGGSVGSSVSADNTSTASSISASQDKAESPNQGGSATSSDYIIFRDLSCANTPKMGKSSGTTKPKIILAPRFSLGNSPHRNELDIVHNNVGKTSKVENVVPSTESRFKQDYDNIRYIGKGSFGRVLKARRKLEQKFFAVKIVKSTKKALREVGALSALEHPNIVRYYNTWTEDTNYQPELDSQSSSGSGFSGQYLYIQMELCEPSTLKTWIDDRNTKEPKGNRKEDALRIIRQVAHGVKYIHSKQLIHRDLKPANILFSSDQTVKICDFGLVTCSESNGDEEQLRTRHTGTASYMSPEQKSRCDYDQLVDIFALGLIYFELLWKMATKTDIWKKIRAAKFPKEFCEQYRPERKLIEKMLTEKSDKRPDASYVADELDKLARLLFHDQKPERDLRSV